MKKTQRIFIPGDNWIYFKIYTGIKTADWIIADKFFPVIKRLREDKFIDKFIFIRYNDPDFHVRLRFLLSNDTYFSNIIDVVNNTLKPIVEKQLVWKIQLDTYQREMERYNPYLVEDTESLFSIDSICIIQIIRQLQKIQDEKYRWMISLLLTDKLLSDLDFTLEQKKDLMISTDNAFKTEFGFNQFNSKQFNEKYRVNKSTVESVLKGNIIDDNFNKLNKIVCQRSAKMEPIIRNIQKVIKLKRLSIRDYVGSYMHMTMNRLFRTDNRLHELIIYDFMRRYYISQIAINKQELYHNISIR
jgi:thiopeptide-type bacteriocin biosynthesis protein